MASTTQSQQFDRTFYLSLSVYHIFHNYRINLAYKRRTLQQFSQGTLSDEVHSKIKPWKIIVQWNCYYLDDNN